LCSAFQSPLVKLQAQRPRVIFAVHKDIIIARCPHLASHRKIISDVLYCGEEGVIDVDHPSSGFAILVKHMYTGSIEYIKQESEFDVYMHAYFTAEIYKMEDAMKEILSRIMTWRKRNRFPPSGLTIFADNEYMISADSALRKFVFEDIAWVYGDRDYENWHNKDFNRDEARNDVHNLISTDRALTRKGQKYVHNASEMKLTLCEMLRAKDDYGNTTSIPPAYRGPEYYLGNEKQIMIKHKLPVSREVRSGYVKHTDYTREYGTSMVTSSGSEACINADDDGVVDTEKELPDSNTHLDIAIISGEPSCHLADGLPVLTNIENTMSEKRKARTEGIRSDTIPTIKRTIPVVTEASGVVVWHESWCECLDCHTAFTDTW